MAAPHLSYPTPNEELRALIEHMTGVLGRMTQPRATSDEDRAQVAPSLQSYIRACDNYLVIRRAAAPTQNVQDEIDQLEFVRRLAFLVLAARYPESAVGWSEEEQAQERGGLPILLADPQDLRAAAREALTEHAATYAYLADR
jgi:hypothetical protein